MRDVPHVVSDRPPVRFERVMPRLFGVADRLVIETHVLMGVEHPVVQNAVAGFAQPSCRENIIHRGFVSI